MESQTLLESNESLKKTSLILFGESAELRLVDPRSLVLLKENARYFKKEMFKQLVQNVKADKKLSSVPLCHVVEGGKLEVLSGNHRVQASVEARLEVIMVMVILEDLSKSRQIAIQLSHNALVGVDDPQILANLWAKIDDIKAKCYAGLNSATIAIDKCLFYKMHIALIDLQGHIEKQYPPLLWVGDKKTPVVSLSTFATTKETIKEADKVYRALRSQNNKDV